MRQDPSLPTRGLGKTGLFQPAAECRCIFTGAPALVTCHCLLCPQTDTSDPEKVVSAFLKVSSVFKDEATVRTAVQDAVGNTGWVGRGWLCLLAASGLRDVYSPWSP